MTGTTLGADPERPGNPPNLFELYPMPTRRCNPERGESAVGGLPAIRVGGRGQWRVEVPGSLEG